MATENWDAPIILTTNVQFFESLFANRTSRCRKLHNIANSVVILDEAQQIPPEFKAPIEGALSLLARQYNATIVLSTATQPVLNLNYAGELAPDPSHLFEALNRVEITLPPDRNETVEWDKLVLELASHPKVLCIVNSRPDARELHRLMPKGTYHLSALMCPAHRAKVLAEIKEKVGKTGETVGVISTQLVEAGVDIDFPVVYRAMAGLDSIAQAAGRCNREGRMKGLGRVVVFNPPKTMQFQKKAVNATREILAEQTILEQRPDLFMRYFKLFYDAQNSPDKHGIVALLSLEDNKHPHFSFREAAEKFRLIDEAGWNTVIIPYDKDARDRIALLPMAMKDNRGLLRKLLRELQRYTVSIRESDATHLLAQEDLLEIWSGLYALKPDRMESRYSEATGLEISEERLIDSINLIF
jgi:CRISPR-associated endonuclease/helicase Cas3